MDTIHCTKATADPDTLYSELQEGEAVLLHLGTHSYYGLNQTGVRIWQLMSQGLTLAEICQALEDQFDVPTDEIHRERAAGFNTP